MAIDRHRSVNRDYWDGEVALNLESWDIEGFLADPIRLTRMVAVDRPALGDVKGRRLIHLQCHFGLDTLAWARLGAIVTGTDFAPRAIATARDLASRVGLPARFVETELYATPEVLPEDSRSSIRAAARSAGCRTSVGGGRSSAACSSRAGSSISGKRIPSSGRWRTNDRTRSS